MADVVGGIVDRSSILVQELECHVALPIACQIGYRDALHEGALVALRDFVRHGGLDHQFRQIYRPRGIREDRAQPPP